MRLRLNKYRFQAALGVLVFCISWTLGYGMAKSVYQTQISRLKTIHAQQIAEREQQETARLQAALAEQRKWQQFAQTQSAQLVQMQQKLDTQAAQLHKEIPHAIAQDKQTGADYNGIGTHSLRQYNRAFGYTD